MNIFNLGFYIDLQTMALNFGKQKLKHACLKGYFTSGKMNVYLKWKIYVEEM